MGRFARYSMSDLAGHHWSNHVPIRDGELLERLLDLHSHIVDEDVYLGGGLAHRFDGLGNLGGMAPVDSYELHGEGVIQVC